MNPTAPYLVRRHDPARAVPRRTILACCLAALPLAAGGCADAGAGGIHAAWEGLEERRGDTLVVRTIDGSVWGDTMSLVPELAIGELDGAEEYLFGNIRGVDVDDEGRIYAADTQAAVVRVFSAEGVHVRTIGRRGEGPGEFSEPDLARVRSDGRLVVRDQRNARYSVFTREGEFLTSWPTAGGFMTSTPFFLDLDGRAYHPTLKNLGAALSDWQHGLVRFEPAGTVVDTLDVPSRGYEAPYIEASSNGGVSRTSVPFTPQETWTMDGDGGFLFGIGHAYSFDWVRRDGSVLRIEREAEAVPVESGERARRREAAIAQMRSVDPNWRWQGAEIPSVKPPFQGFHAGADGTVWVRRHVRAVEEDNPGWNPDDPEAQPRTRWVEPLVFDVFDEEGRYFGPVRGPRGMQTWSTPVLTRDRVWAVVLNEDFGHPQVVRYRVGREEG
jgi:hypothetical protein